MLTLEAWVDIKAMHRQGRSIRSIAKERGISRNTVRRYLRDEKPPHYAARPKRPSILEPHKDYVTKRIEELTVRFETAPGDQLQVDWSEFGRLPDGRKLYALAPVLGWSRTLFVYFTTRMVVQELLYGLVQSFEYFGGVPRTLLFDNPKTVVLRRGETVEDSTLHPRFLDFLGHYGLTLRLCKVRRAQTKGKVERPMEYIWTSLV